MITATKYFHVHPIDAIGSVMFRAEYFEIGDHGWIGFWVGDLLVGSCWAPDILKITYIEDGAQITIDDFEEGKYGI